MSLTVMLEVEIWLRVLDDPSKHMYAIVVVKTYEL